MPALVPLAAHLVLTGAGPEPPSGYGLMLLRAVLALAGVCLLAYLALRMLGRRVAGSAPSPGLLRVVARVGLEPRRAVYIIEAAGRFFLLGAGESGAPATLGELDAEAVRAAAASAAPRASFLELVSGRARGAADRPTDEGARRATGPEGEP